MNLSRSTLLACLLPVGLAICFHSWAVTSGGGVLIGPDGFLRLVRVAELADSWAWYEHTVARINAPHGMSLHWTRPFDLLLLAGAGLLSPFMGFEQGLRWSGVWVSPALHLCTLVALFWATAPMLDTQRRFLALVAALGHVGIIAYGMAGRADHHMALLLVFVVSFGLSLRMLLHHHDVRLALAGGAVLGLGLWLSLEFLLILVLTLGALGLHWMRHGGSARRNQWHALGLGLVILAALLAEQPPGAYLSAEYDRISVVHLFVASLVFGLWTALRALERKRPECASMAVRATLLGLGALLAAGLLFAVYPKFFGGPGVDIDPRLKLIIQDEIHELQPLFPTDSVTLAQFLLFLGPTLVAVPFLVYLLWRERRGANWEAWLYLGLMTALFLPLGLAMVRFAPYVGILTAIPLAVLLSSLMTFLNRLVSLALVRLTLRFVLVCLFVLGFAAAGSAMYLSGAREPIPACKIAGLAAQLNDPRGLGDRSRIILAHRDHGSELLYRTRHAVIAAFYHRNTQGILDADRMFRSRDPALSHRMIRQRGASLILLCVDEDAPESTLYDEESFIRQLLQGHVPGWLRQLDVRPEAKGQFLLFEVVG